MMSSVFDQKSSLWIQQAHKHRVDMMLFTLVLGLNSCKLCPAVCCCLRQVVDEHSSRSFRMLAIAAGVVHGVSKLDLSSMSLPQLEGRCKLQLLGLTVLTNHLRPESKTVISELHDRCVLSAHTCKRSCDFQGKIRKDYTFWRQSNEKPSVVLGCPGFATSD